MSEGIVNLFKCLWSSFHWLCGNKTSPTDHTCILHFANARHWLRSIWAKSRGILIYERIVSFSHIIVAADTWHRSLSRFLVSKALHTAITFLFLSIGWLWCEGHVYSGIWSHRMSLVVFICVTRNCLHFCSLIVGSVFLFQRQRRPCPTESRRLLDVGVERTLVSESSLIKVAVTCTAIVVDLWGVLILKCLCSCNCLLYRLSKRFVNLLDRLFTWLSHLGLRSRLLYFICLEAHGPIKLNINWHRVTAWD